MAQRPSANSRPSASLRPAAHYWRSQFKIALHNAFASDPEKKIKVTREGDIYNIKSGEDELKIVAIDRWVFYKQGLDKRLETLVGQYKAQDWGDELKGQTIIDIGSNVGEFALYCQRLGARAFAIEPDAVNFQALEKNLAGTDVSIHQIALWDEERKLKFYSSIDGADSSVIKPRVVDTTYHMDAIPLDKFAKECGIEDVFLIKGDAEGAEIEVLNGGRETLKRTRHITMDCGPERGGKRTTDECRAILEELDFEVAVAPSRGGLLLGTNRRFVK